MKTNYIEKMGQYKKIEKYSHITLDDVINKVTQEVWELVEAFDNWDNVEMYKEAGDVLINIFSVSSELWIEIDFDSNLDISKKTISQLFILLWNWNTKIQWLRKRYTRENISIEDAWNITTELVSEILNYSDPNLTMLEIIDKSIEKFETRKEMYKSKIDLDDYIWKYPDFPKKWINFMDISPLLQSPEALRYSVLEISKKCLHSDIIVWLDARGFIFWSLVSDYLWKPFVMLRKKWKLPWKTQEISYWLEYWKDVLEIQDWVIWQWKKVSIIDDLLATWWTIKAAIDLVELQWWIINNLSFVISLDGDDLINLDSRKLLSNYEIDSLLSYN
jgi:adenine phosphoribosyltransferase